MSTTELKPNKPASRWRTIVTIITIVALLLLVYVLRDEIKGVFENLERVNVWALALMIPLQLINYHSYARLYQRLLKILKEDISYKNLYKLQLELNFVNNVFPSGGVSGVSYFSLRMNAFGASPSKGTLTQVMKFALVFISFQILLAVGLVALAVAGKANDLMLLVAGSLATLLAIGTLLAGYIMQSKSRINSFITYSTKFINRSIHFLRPKHPETISMNSVEKLLEELHENYQILKGNWRQLKIPLVYALIANIAEVLTIYAVYIAFGEFVNIGAVIIAYAVANFAGLISVLPGGVGIYEALMTTVLVTAGVPAALSIPVTVMYRVINMLIQLPPGYYFYHKALAGNGFSKNP